MNAITIEKLSDRALAIIAERARAHGASIEDEVTEIVELAVGAQQTPNWRLASADRIAAMTPGGLKQSDSTLLIREDRDR